MILVRVFPTIVLAWLFYHCVALAHGVAYDESLAGVLAMIVATVPLLNDGDWHVTVGDCITMVTVGSAFLEVLKASSATSVQMINHALSAVLFTVVLVEFLAFRLAQNSVFFFIVLALFLYLVVSYAVGMRTARRDFSVGRLS